MGEKADEAISAANHGPMKDHAPGNKASRKIEEAMQLIRPMADDQFTPEEKLDVEGPYLTEQVDSAQSAVTREDGGTAGPSSQPASSEGLLPAALLAPGLFVATSKDSK